MPSALASTTSTYPIDTLPIEIWTAIIKEYITNRDLGFPFMDADRLLPLMLVSTSWRDRILDTPTLWTDILLSDSVEDLEMKVVTALHLSKDAPITLYLVEGGCCSVIAPILVQERPRISSVWLTNYGFDVGMQQSALLATLFPLPTLSKLQSDGCTLKPKLLEMHPLLTDISGFYIDFAELIKIPRALQSICVDKDPKAILSSVEGIQSLKTVAFTGKEAEGSFDYWHNDEPLSWESLRLTITDNRFNSYLLSRLQCTLVYLDINLCIDPGTVNLIHSLGYLNCLYDCTIQISPSYDGHELQPHGYEVIHKSKARRLLFDTQKSDGMTDKNLHILGEALQAMMPLIDELSLSVYHPDELLPLLRGPGFSQITGLSLYHSTHDPEYLNENFIRSFSHLISIMANIPVKMYHSLHSPTVERIDCSFESNIGRISLDTFNQWTVLHSLDIRDCQASVSFDNFSLPQMRRFVLDHTFDSAALCHHLALHPHSCPMLEELSLGSIPEWDIFFIMLERRNLSRYPVAPLTQVTLPDRCARYLRRPIRQLMQGIAPVRPCYYDLSVYQIEKELRNPEITGCTMCLRAHVFCKEGSGQDWPEGYQYGTGQLLSREEYPNDPEQILLNWDRPRNRFESGRFRLNDCYKGGNHSITITKDSVDSEGSMCEWSEGQFLGFLYPDSTSPRNVEP